MAACHHGTGTHFFCAAVVVLSLSRLDDLSGTNFLGGAADFIGRHFVSDYFSNEFFLKD